MEEIEMHQLKVYLSDKNYICIEQSDYGGDDTIIVIHPDQVDTLIKWLNEARNELNDL